MLVLSHLSAHVCLCRQPERPATEAQQLEEQAQPAEKAQDEDGMTPADVKE